jgi:hypothetical protein
MNKIKVTIKCRGQAEVTKVVHADDLSAAMDIVQNEMEAAGFFVEFLSASFA